jgi:predicted lipoprotein with Yx(FWY)xxD motif
MLALVVAIAGCGGSSGSSATASSGSGGTAASTGGGGHATVDVANNPQLGNILVDSKGLTLYTFQNDTGSMSTCNGSCAQFWPPLIASGKPSAGSGVSAGMLGTSKRSDGSTQVTFAGHPVYTYSLDSSPGQTTGNGINSSGGIWNAVQPSGAKAPMGSSGGSGSSGSAGSSSAGSSSTTGSSGGYGY